jgi:hypothetical protein
MGKQPAFWFYPNDWLRDMEEYPLEIQGAWIVLLCKLWWSETKGTATKSLREWMNVLRKKKQKTINIISFLEQKKIAKVSFLEQNWNKKGSFLEQKSSNKISGLLNQSLNQMITITSRRMVEDERISQLRREAGRQGGNPALQKSDKNISESESDLVNQNDKQKSTPPIPSPIPYPVSTTNTEAEAEKKQSPKPSKPRSQGHKTNAIYLINPPISESENQRLFDEYCYRTSRKNYKFTPKRRAQQLCAIFVLSEDLPELSASEIGEAILDSATDPSSFWVEKGLLQEHPTVWGYGPGFDVQRLLKRVISWLAQKEGTRRRIIFTCDECGREEYEVQPSNTEANGTKQCEPCFKRLQREGILNEIGQRVR